MVPSLDERRFDAPDKSGRIRLAMSETEGESLQRQGL